LKERADEDDRNLRFFGQAEDADRERAEHGRGHVTHEVDERLEQPRNHRERAAQDPERQAEQRRPEKAPEDHFTALEQAFVEPELTVADRLRDEGRIQRGADRMWRLEVDGVGAFARGYLGVGPRELLIARGELGSIHELPRGQVGVGARHARVTRVLDQDQGMPQERHVADGAPREERERKGEDACDQVRARRQGLAHRHQARSHGLLHRVEAGCVDARGVENAGALTHVHSPTSWLLR
jgi:hypothetical protein